MDDQEDQLLLRVRPEPLPVGDREATLQLLVAEAAELLQSAENTAAMYADAWERELAEPTYIGSGLAVPHARVPGLQRAAVYVGYSPAGIPWPHEEAHHIALLIVPQESPELHLQLLAHLVRWRRSLTEAEACAWATESSADLAASLEAAFPGML